MRRLGDSAKYLSKEPSTAAFALQPSALKKYLGVKVIVPGEEGLHIRRGESAGDARSLPVELTKEGRKRAEAAFREDMKVQAALLDALSPSEKKALEELLRKVVLTLARNETTPAP